MKSNLKGSPPMLMDVNTSALLVIDIQSKLMPAIHGADQVIANSAVLMAAARRMTVPTLVSAQYPRGLGDTVEQLSAVMPDGGAISKTAFSCVADSAYNRRFAELGRVQAVLVGAEAHVCVLQTAMSLLEADADVFVVADAVSSRTTRNRDLALERLRAEGAKIVTTEMVIFEWLRDAEAPEFKELSALIK